ncbi:MAG TPA: SGNH/GDSL hydrolase family protein, partial [Verrucomicrobiota bacterium]|nr:SGNH/GDSL hydrolase family protein [Verrucomicrobiota bacterium]
VLLAFLGGEIYFRHIHDTTDSIAYTKVARQWIERYCVYNSAGFRDNVQYSLEIEPGKSRVSFVGDSFTAGHGIKSVEARFPNLIRAAHPEWEIHVLARFGIDTGMELRLLQQSVADGYKFDQVVLVYCLNDIADLFPEWSDALYRLMADAERGGWLRRHSFFLDTIYHRYRAARDPVLNNYYSFVKDGYRGELWNVQKERLKAIRDLVEANGGRLLAVTFPFIHESGDDYEYAFVHKQLDQLWNELGVPHLDLMPVLKVHPSGQIVVNRFDAHPNEFANQLVARAVDEFLNEQLRASPPAPTQGQN